MNARFAISTLIPTPLQALFYEYKSLPCSSYGIYLCFNPWV